MDSLRIGPQGWPKVALAAIIAALAALLAATASPAGADTRAGESPSARSPIPGAGVPATHDQAARTSARSPQARKRARQRAKRRAKRKRRRALMRRKQRPTYWGAWIGDHITGTAPPWDMGAVHGLHDALGKGMSLIQFSAPFGDCHRDPCRFYPFPTEQMEKVRSYGAIPVFSWSSASSPWKPGEISQPDYQLADVIAGAYDGYIRDFATAARDWGHPFFLRFNWEMNGNWFPWAERVNGNRRGEFVAAWRRVHDIFTAVGATNATWVWCPYADVKGRFQNLRSVYPGHRYVDWTCLDGYNWAENPANPHPWRSFDKIFARSYRIIIRRIARGKPMMLAEMASTGRGRAKAAWIRNMFRMLRIKYRRVRALVWFNKIDRGIDWPLETSPRAVHAFRQGLRQRGFAPNHFADLDGGRIRPPR